MMAVITTVACNNSEEDVAVIIGLIGAVLGEQTTTYEVLVSFVSKPLGIDFSPEPTLAYEVSVSFLLEMRLIPFTSVFSIP